MSETATPESGSTAEDSRSNAPSLTHVADSAVHAGAELQSDVSAVNPATPAASDPHLQQLHSEVRPTLDALMEAHGDALYSLCLRVLRDPVQAEDMLQQVFLEAHRDLVRFEGRASLRTWLFSIAIHRCQDAIKAKRRLLRRIESNEEEVVAFEDPGKGPEACLLQQRQLVDLENCLGVLSSDARLTVLLRYLVGMSYEEMAEELDAKSDTLQRRVTRALPMLKRCLERKGWTSD